MGLAIVLQSRRASRLELARSLGWLAAFGIIHGLNEWADLFIPIQAAYTSETLIRLLYILQLVLLSFSFAFLFQFGVSLLNTLGKARWLRSAPIHPVRPVDFRGVLCSYTDRNEYLDLVSCFQRAGA